MSKSFHPRNVLRVSILSIGLLFSLITAPVWAAGAQIGWAEPTPDTAPGKVIYLTFDDGPRNPYTQQMLDVLAKYNAKATFFVIGRQAAAQPELIEGIYAAGHGLGNHTYNHRSLPGLGWEAFQSDVEEGRNALAAYNTVCMRPPYGKVDGNTSAFAAKMGYHVVLWSIDPHDWALPGADAIAGRVVSKAYPGAIVVLHDGGGDRSQTVTALDTILARLSEQGYTFASMCRDGAAPPPLTGFHSGGAVGPNGIKTPASDSIASGTILVTGVAVSSEFQKWQLDLLPFGNEAQTVFLALGETSLPTASELLQWNTALYPNGSHLLRLRVVRKDGNYDEFMTPVTISNN
jgi:peptidoglycan/xylan/chitin deacetylase (PgdA/CDA1 family)